ncbi:MAG: hypothetical protein HY332_07755 [Chloroflexi bacterium]|nr:hypothetical protein [Chloroflexota bacterium]
MSSSPAKSAETVAQGRPVRYCTRHPKRETLIACGRCERPFCPECLIYTAAGQRCYECAGVRRGAAGYAAASAFLKTMGIAAIGSGIGSLTGLLFMLLAAGITGAMSGQMLAPVVTRKTRRTVYALALAALAAGAQLGWIAGVMLRMPPNAGPFELRLIAVVQFAATNWAIWIFVAIAAAVAYRRVR